MGVVGIILYLAFFIGLMYLMIIKPQKKQQKQMEDLHNAMEPGDTIMTTGGFYGTLLDIVDDTTVIVEFGNDRHCRIPMHPNAIAEQEIRQQAWQGKEVKSSGLIFSFMRKYI